MSKKLKFSALVLIGIVLSINQVWAVTIASWGKVSISANTAVKASGGDANNNGTAQFSSNKAMTTAGTNCYYGSSAGGAVITFSNLNLSGYTGITMTFYTRASQQGNMKIQYTTNGSTWTDLDSPGPSITKSEAQKTSSTIPNTATGLKLTHSKTSGSLYFGTITISGTAAAVCNAPGSLTNGTITASTQPVSWTGSASQGYIVAVGATADAPGDVKMSSGASPYSSGNYYYTLVSSSTKNFTFGEDQYVYAGIEYHWWVRSKCGENDYSGWSSGTAFTIPSSCNKSVTINAGAATNCSLSFSTGASGSSLETCSSTPGDRQVTITVTPNTCYAAPVAGSVTSTGTACTITGPSGSGPYTYVAQFAQNAASSTTFSCVLSTKTTYTVSYNKGTYGTGNNSSGTKTCGTALVLPNTAMFTRTGYTQTGWSTAQAGTSKNYNLGGSYTTDAATTLYPYWEANQYTVTWKVNNTNYSAGGQANVNHGSHVTTLPTAPNPASYCGQKFMGWTTSEVVTPQAAEPTPLYKTASEFPNATGNQEFHAVFAEYDE